MLHHHAIALMVPVKAHLGQVAKPGSSSGDATPSAWKDSISRTGARPVHDLSLKLMCELPLADAGITSQITIGYDGLAQ
jgi:hypothetical protein